MLCSSTSFLLILLTVLVVIGGVGVGVVVVSSSSSSRRRRRLRGAQVTVMMESQNKNNQERTDKAQKTVPSSSLAARLVLFSKPAKPRLKLKTLETSQGSSPKRTPLHVANLRGMFEQHGSPAPLASSRHKEQWEQTASHVVKQSSSTSLVQEVVAAEATATATEMEEAAAQEAVSDAAGTSHTPQAANNSKSKSPPESPYSSLTIAPDRATRRLIIPSPSSTDAATHSLSARSPSSNSSTPISSPVVRRLSSMEISAPTRKPPPSPRREVEGITTVSTPSTTSADLKLSSKDNITPPANQSLRPPPSPLATASSPGFPKNTADGLSSPTSPSPRFLRLSSKVTPPPSRNPPPSPLAASSSKSKSPTALPYSSLTVTTDGATHSLTAPSPNWTSSTPSSRVPSKDIPPPSRNPPPSPLAANRNTSPSDPSSSLAIPPVSPTDSPTSAVLKLSSKDVTFPISRPPSSPMAANKSIAPPDRSPAPTRAPPPRPAVEGAGTPSISSRQVSELTSYLPDAAVLKVNEGPSASLPATGEQNQVSVKQLRRESILLPEETGFLVPAKLVRSDKSQQAGWESDESLLGSDDENGENLSSGPEGGS
eukprot:g4362.t1